MSAILIVDDKPGKYSTLWGRIDRSIDAERDVTVASCLRDGLHQLQRRHFDVLIVDMLLPEAPWGSPVEDGGVRLLAHLEEDPDLKLPTYIIGITAAVDPIAGVEEAFQSKPWVLLKTANGAPWEERLLALIRHAFDSEAEQDAARYDSELASS